MLGYGWDMKDIYERKFKPHTHFSHAYEAWTGKRWQWEIDGKRNDPMDADELTRAFYIGFGFAKKGQKTICDIRSEIKDLNIRVKKLNKRLDKYSR